MVLGQVGLGLLGIAEAAALIGVSERKVRRLLAAYHGGKPRLTSTVQVSSVFQRRTGLWRILVRPFSSARDYVLRYPLVSRKSAMPDWCAAFHF